MGPHEVLDFWLHEVGPEGWYAGGEALDAEVREGFADLWRAARDGGLEHWVEGAAGALGFIILTDQLPRNMWRGQADAFATDALECRTTRAGHQHHIDDDVGAVGDLDATTRIG